MGSGDKLAVGRPDAMVEAGYLFFKYCGGGGAGACVVPTGQTGVVLDYRLQRYIVYNKRIVFENKEFFGARFYTDAGSDGSCPNSLGSEVPFYMALSIDGNLTDAEVQAQGVQLSGALPYDIEFLSNKIPQPSEGAWSDHIFVHLYWGSSAYIWENSIAGATVPTDAAFRIKKHDYDIRL